MNRFFLTGENLQIDVSARLAVLKLTRSMDSYPYDYGKIILN